MIYLNDGSGVIDFQVLHKSLKVRIEKLRKIVEDEGNTQERREWAFKEIQTYYKDLDEIDDLLKIPFDVLIVRDRG